MNHRGRKFHGDRVFGIRVGNSRRLLDSQLNREYTEQRLKVKDITDARLRNKQIMKEPVDKTTVTLTFIGIIVLILLLI